ncbi:MAG: heme exporter protein CcmD [Rhizobiales bacterium]|nr:heme exporter protein CcmD [Rhizobacter sp.]
MNWTSLAEFAAMGGYGLYVWGSFGVTALVIAGEMISLRVRRRALLAATPTADDERPTHVAYPEGAA